MAVVEPDDRPEGEFDRQLVEEFEAELEHEPEAEVAAEFEEEAERAFVEAFEHDLEGQLDDSSSRTADDAGPFELAHDYDLVLAEAEQTLDDVDHALKRLDDGSYGTCEECGGPIEERRLEALPAARTCEGHPQLTDQLSAG